MKGKIPLLIRLALVAVLAVSFSLVPLAVNPAPAQATPSLTTAGAAPQMSTRQATTTQVNAGIPLRLASTGFTASGAGTVTVSAGAYDIATSYNNLGTATASAALGTSTATVTGGSATSLTGGTLAVGINTVTVTTSAVSQTFNVILPAGVAGWATSGTATLAAPVALPPSATTLITITNDIDGTVIVTIGRIAVTADASGNIVVEGTYYNPTTTAATITLTATDTTSSTSATTTLAVATSVERQVKITVGSLVAYADPSTAPLPYIPTFAKVGDAITVESTNTTGDFTAGGPITISFDGVAQTVLGNTTVDAAPMSGGSPNTNYRKFNSTIIIPAVTGTSVVTSAGGAPLAGKTTRLSDGVYTIIFAVGVTPKARFSPNLGGMGATITVAGSGFGKSKGITLYSSPGAVTAATLVTTATAVSSGVITTDASGNFSGTFASLANTSRISVVDGDGSMALNVSRLDETGSSFTVKPSISISPTSGKPGDTITLTGSNWTASTAFKVFFGVEAVDYAATGLGTPTTTGTSDSSGQILSTTFAVPPALPSGAALVPGVYKVYVVESTNRDQSTSITVSALPMTATPSSSPRYGKVTVTVSGLSGAGTIGANSMTLAGAPWNSPGNSGLFITGLASTGVITLDGAGAATFTLRVPAGASTGRNEIMVTDNNSRVAKGVITVATPTIVLSPTEAARNATVAITGKGWVPDQTVTVTAAVTGKTSASASAVPLADGSFIATITVPTGWAADDTATVTATDGTIGNTSAATILHVPVAKITVSPTVAKWGDTVTIKGSGFRGGSTIRALVPWDPASTANSFPTAVYTDSAGNFTGTFILPTVDKGVQSIGATDGTVNATGTIEVQEAPATTASALAPIATVLVRVWAFDAATQTWKLYDPSVPAELNTLAALSKGSGYFINVKAATSILTASGVQVSLSAGWNLIGW